MTHYYLLNQREFRLFVVTLAGAGFVVLVVFLALANQTYQAYTDPLERLTHVPMAEHGFPNTTFIVIHKVTSVPYEPEYNMVNDFAFVSRHPCWIDEDNGQTWFLFRPRLASIERREVEVKSRECDDPSIASTCDEEGETIMKIIVSKFTLPYKVTPGNVAMREPSDRAGEAYAEYMQVQDSRWSFSGDWRTDPGLTVSADGEWRPWPPPPDRTTQGEGGSAFPASCLRPRDIPYPRTLGRFVLFRGSVMGFQNFTAEDPGGDEIRQRRLQNGHTASWPMTSFYILPVVDEGVWPSPADSPNAQFEEAYNLVESTVAGWGLINVLRNAPQAWKPVPLRDIKNLIQATFPEGTWVGKSTARGVQKLKLRSYKTKNERNVVTKRELRMDLEYDPDSLPDWDNAYENGHANPFPGDQYYGLDCKGQGPLNSTGPAYWDTGGRCWEHGTSTPLELRADLDEWVTDQVVTMTILNMFSQLLSAFTGMFALIKLLFPTVLTLPLIFKPLGPLNYFYKDRSRGNRAQLIRLLLEEPVPQDEVELSDLRSSAHQEWPDEPGAPKNAPERSTTRMTVGDSAPGGASLIRQQTDWDGATEWIVIRIGGLAVRESKFASSDRLAGKQFGDLVYGTREGGWIALSNEPGYVRLEMPDGEKNLKPNKDESEGSMVTPLDDASIYATTYRNVSDSIRANWSKRRS